MKTRAVETPAELLDLLERTSVGDYSEEDRARIALAALLFHQKVVSTGKATRLSGLPRDEFELPLGAMEFRR